MRSTLEKLEFSHLTPNESAWLRCQAALELKDRGEYDRAQEVMRPFWKRFGERPNTEGLDPSMAAELLQTVGILTRWIGTKNQISTAQDVAKDLISESIRLFETLGDPLRVPAARAEVRLLLLVGWSFGRIPDRPHRSFRTTHQSTETSEQMHLSF